MSDIPEELLEIRSRLQAALARYEGRAEEIGERPSPSDAATLALLDAQAAYRDMSARVRGWGQEAGERTRPAPASVKCRCGAETDRRCLGCRARYCTKCVTAYRASGGAVCPRCSGPVYGDNQPLGAVTRNPKMVGY